MNSLIAPSDTLTEAGIRMLRQQLDRFMEHADSLPLLDDPEPVHRMRVASRRMRAVLRVFREGLGPWADAVKDHLTGIANELGDIRDADVYREFLEHYADHDCPREHLRSVRAMARAEYAFRCNAMQPLLDHVSSGEHAAFIANFRREMEERLAEEAANDRTARIHLDRAAPKLLRRGIKHVLEYDRPLGKYNSEELHALRITCKRLRYTAEFLAPLYADNLDSLRTPVLAMHRLLGDVHDADVYHRRLKAVLKKKPHPSAAKAAAIEALDAHLKTWRRKQLRKATTTWKSLTHKGGAAALASVRKSRQRPEMV